MPKRRKLPDIELHEEQKAVLKRFTEERAIALLKSRTGIEEIPLDFKEMQDTVSSTALATLLNDIALVTGTKEPLEEIYKAGKLVQRSKADREQDITEATHHLLSRVPSANKLVDITTQNQPKPLDAVTQDICISRRDVRTQMEPRKYALLISKIKAVGEKLEELFDKLEDVTQVLAAKEAEKPDTQATGVSIKSKGQTRE